MILAVFLSTPRHSWSHNFSDSVLAHSEKQWIDLSCRSVKVFRDILLHLNLKRGSPGYFFPLSIPQRELQVNENGIKAGGLLLFRMNLISQISLCSFLQRFIPLPCPHVIKTCLNFLRGLTCLVMGVASIPFRLHCLAVIHDGRVNTEFHVEHPCSSWLSCCEGPQSTDRSVGLGRDVRGEESHYAT